MTIVVVHDATHANISHLPAGQAAGYTTGSPDIKWTDPDWVAHPRAVRIDQDWQAGDSHADMLDVERGAATSAEAAGWYKAALAAFTAAARPGQRHPAFYCSALNVTPLVNALIAGGVHSGPGLWVANWNLSDPQAVAEVVAASGPYPIIGVQFTDNAASGGFYDTSVFSAAWLDAVSGAAPPPPPGGPHRHTFTGSQTWNDVAKARNTTATTLRATTAKALTAADLAVMNNQVQPKGEPYYTINR